MVEAIVMAFYVMTQLWPWIHQSIAVQQTDVAAAMVLNDALHSSGTYLSEVKSVPPSIF